MRLLGRCGAPAGSTRPSPLLQPARLQLARGLQDGIGDRANVRVDALQVTQHVEVQRTRLDALRASFTKPSEMIFRGGARRFANLNLLPEELASDADIARHEDAERELQIVDNASMNAMARCPLCSSRLSRVISVT